MEFGDLADGVLTGNRRSVGRAISLIENEGPAMAILLRRLYPHTGHAYRIGLTGPPGAGKSTLADELIRVIRQHGLTVGVIAVDPNSPFSGGAVLGDRIRMMRHSSDLGVYIRSMGARGHLGGLARAADNAALILDAMGEGVILLETVGVGQSELEIAGTADTTVVVIPPGAGDGVQAIKAGIMEIADVFVVNKADHPQANKAVAEIRDLLRMDVSPGPWTPPIVKTIATQNEGLEELWKRIEQHRLYLEESGLLDRRRRLRLERTIRQLAERKMREQYLEPRFDSAEFQRMLDDVVERRSDPYDIAERIAEPPSATARK